MSGTMHLVDCLDIIVLVPFVVFMCVCTILVTRKVKAYTLKSFKAKPNLNYLKSRITANTVLNEFFPSIKVLSRKLLHSRKCYADMPGVYPDEMNRKNCTRDRNPFEADQITSGIEEIVGSEFMLMEKLNNLYITLVQNASNRKDMENAIRFEIRKRCMKHPHDIFGAHVCKKIDSLYHKRV